MKRYAIVRVDNICPPIKMFCSDRKIDCKNCLHGDTKEQLIRKVAQAIFRKINKFGDKWQNKIWTEADIRYSYKLAKQIVEFLGVEE